VKSTKTEKHIVPDQKGQTRLSDYAVGVFESVTTRKGIKKAISKGWIKVNGKRGTTGMYIKGGEKIELAATKSKKPSLNLKLEVVFQDDYIAVINKPAGLIVSGNQKRTLENALSHNLEDSPEVDALQHPLPVHRLDHATSGLILIAKTRKAQTALSEAFAERKIDKTYHAITIGVSSEEGTIETAIKEKSAFTTFKKINKVESEKYSALNLMELMPKTGRRHQLRVHMLENKTPILGDKKYFLEGKVSYGTGLYLAATGLSFKHPITEESLKFSIDLPKKFEKIFPVVES